MQITTFVLYSGFPSAASTTHSLLGIRRKEIAGRDQPAESIRTGPHAARLAEDGATEDGAVGDGVPGAS